MNKTFGTGKQEFRGPGICKLKNTRLSDGIVGFHRGEYF